MKALDPSVLMTQLSDIKFLSGTMSGLRVDGVLVSSGWFNAVSGTLSGLRVDGVATVRWLNAALTGGGGTSGWKLASTTRSLSGWVSR